MAKMVGADLRRLVSAVGVYAMASVAQKGLAFLLIPIYTRHIDPAQYGILELLNAFSTIAFGLLALGMPSALMKCFHRDCRDVPEQQTILATSAAISLLTQWLTNQE